MKERVERKEAVMIWRSHRICDTTRAHSTTKPLYA